MVITLLRAFLSGDYSRLTRADSLTMYMSDEWITQMRARTRTEV